MATYVEPLPNPKTPVDDHCPNCGAALTGNYCHNCGQKKMHREEFSVKHFFGHLVHEFTHLDSNKILKTLSGLVFKPGLLTSEYLAGRKGSYINPIRIYLTFSALYFLFAWGVLSDIRGGGARGCPGIQRRLRLLNARASMPMSSLTRSSKKRKVCGGHTVW